MNTVISFYLFVCSILQLVTLIYTALSPLAVDILVSH